MTNAHSAHRFVRNVPRELEQGVLYMSMDYATAVNSSCCGCGDCVVTPFTRPDWGMTFDGESISLYPSVGNWNQKCRSHHVIQQNRVLKAGAWSNSQVDTEVHLDEKAKAAYYSQQRDVQSVVASTAAGYISSPATEVNARSLPSVRSCVKVWLTS